VCKSFFCSTIDIGKSAAPVMLAHRYISSVGTFSGQDNRGKHAPWNKTPDSKTALVHEHLNLIPKTASHYCRKDSRRQYIDPQLTVPRLFELYLDWLKEKSNAAPDDSLLQEPLSERGYREIIVNDFNIPHFIQRKTNAFYVRVD
jgi:hypothetical protein